MCSEGCCVIKTWNKHTLLAIYLYIYNVIYSDMCNGCLYINGKSRECASECLSCICFAAQHGPIYLIIASPILSAPITLFVSLLLVAHCTLQKKWVSYFGMSVSTFEKMEWICRTVEVGTRAYARPNELWPLIIRYS